MDRLDPHIRLPAPARSGGLPVRLALLAGVVLLAGMSGIGLWVNGQIRQIAIANAGATAALHVDAMIAPAIQGMAATDGLDASATDRLAHVLTRGALGREVSSFSLWNRQGRIVYSDRADLIGQEAPGGRRLGLALAGDVQAELQEAADADGPALMRIYSPVRSSQTGKVIAVAEFHGRAEVLRADLRRILMQSWIVVGTIMLATFLILAAVVARASRTFARQRRAMDGQGARLRSEVERVNPGIAAVDAQHLRRLSAELHDGPAQHLAFAALRLDGARGQEQVAQAVNEALRELRAICRGLVLPELETCSVPDIARRLVATHEERNGVRAHLVIAPDLPELSIDARNCVYRFLQETLSNGARHAPGAGQSVTISRHGDGMTVEVSDSGPGFDPAQETSGLGLAGLRDRVAGHKGRFTLRTRGGEGTCVSMWLPGLHADENRHDTHSCD